MPYGPAKAGGKETASYDRWMEKCVADVKAGGKKESNAIAICKSTYAKHHATRQRVLRKV